MKSFCTFFAGICVCFSVFAQEWQMQLTMEELLESVAESLEDGLGHQEMLEDLEYFFQHKLSLNLASREELLSLHLLDDRQVDHLLLYRQKTGDLLSFFELNTVDGFDQGVIRKIAPFVSLETDLKTDLPGKRASNDFFIRAIRNFDSERSFSGNYEGSPERLYVRFRHRSEKSGYGFTAEKDPGEAFGRASNKYGFDYCSAFFNLRLKRSRIFLGDYAIRFGQGLNAWQGFAAGKSSESTQVLKTNQGIRSYSSTDENLFFRGIAADIQLGRFSLYPFLSSHRVDASLDSLDDIPVFSSFQTSGYHRTKSEIENEDGVRKSSAGIYITYRGNNWSLGFSNVYTQLSTRMVRRDELYNQFLFTGKENLVSSVDWKYALNKLFLFGEFAKSFSGGTAMLAGVLTKPVSQFECSMVYRNVDKNYESFYANAFTEYSKVNDEQGFYLGIKFLPFRYWSVQAYSDFFQHQWVTYSTSSPSKGSESLLRINFHPDRRTELYLQYFFEEKGSKDLVKQIEATLIRKIQRLRFDYFQQLHENIYLKSRIEFSFYRQTEMQNGFLFYQDFGYKPEGGNLSFNFRCSVFDVDTYDARIYAYENDLLYAYSISSLFGRGIRTYLNSKWELNKHMALWLKYALTLSYDDKSVGFDSNIVRKSELRVQIRYRF